MSMRVEAVPADPVAGRAQSPVAEAKELRWFGRLLRPRRENVRLFATLFISNTALFSALDLAQWLADYLQVSSLPTNMIASVIATCFGLACAAAGRWLGGDDS